jgi:nitrite reductase/ring-hydroxylating ferredoxin subunit
MRMLGARSCYISGASVPLSMSERYWPVCRCEEVSDPGCREFALQIGETVINGFVVHWQGQWHAYQNSCPHVGVNLNWLPNQFFDVGQEYIQCGLHGALFQPQDGLCIYGPCLGRSLERLCVVQQGGEILIDCAVLAPG